MSQTDSFLKDFHWIMDVLQFIDVGLVILNREYEIQLWNSFMQNHSAKDAEEAMGKCIFEIFNELPEEWFRRKAESVFSLENSSFTTWEQRPYLFKFKSYRPITSLSEYMYQNSTIIPLKDSRGKVDHICLIVYDVTEVAVNRLQIQAANEQLKIISQTDGLTGLLNRKTWEEELEKEFLRFSRHQQPCSLIMFDIDHFKKINDGYGHPAGDAVIRSTAEILKQNIREVDSAGRYGGEEFAVILVNSDAEGAKIVAERIRKQMEVNSIEYDSQLIKYTVSFGISQLTPKMTDRTYWINCADQGLYQAKQAGRNTCIIFEE